MDAFDLLPQINRWYPHHYTTYACNQLAAWLGEQGLYVPRFAAIPADATATIPSRRTVEGLLALEPGSIVWAIAASSQQAEGFKLQISEAQAEKFFQTPVRFAPDASDAITGRLHILNTPRLVIAPLTAQIANLSPSANAVQVVVYYAEPRPGVTPKQAEACYREALAKLQETMQQMARAQQQRTASHVPFREAASINTPAPGAGATLVLSFRVPDGHDCLLRSLSCQYTNPALVEGSGDIVWRIAIDGAYMKGYDAITTTLGSAAAPLEVQGGIPASSGQLIEFYVEHAASSALPYGTSTQIICTGAGQYFPR